MQFKSYRNAEKWCRENFEKFHPDMIGYNDMKEEFKKGGKVTWKKNIGEDGWSSTMENQSAYDNVGGYISESGNWIIFRDGRKMEKIILKEMVFGLFKEKTNMVELKIFMENLKL